jgi:hypothetical protein
MWVLLISLYAAQPLGQTQSKGMIHAPQSSYELCEQERDRINRTWQIDKYKTSARCVYIKHYSTNNGAYTRD